MTDLDNFGTLDCRCTLLLVTMVENDDERISHVNELLYFVVHVTHKVVVRYLLCDVFGVEEIRQRFLQFLSVFLRNRLGKKSCGVVARLEVHFLWNKSQSWKVIASICQSRLWNDATSVLWKVFELNYWSFKVVLWSEKCCQPQFQATSTENGGYPELSHFDFGVLIKFRILKKATRLVDPI